MADGDRPESDAGAAGVVTVRVPAVLCRRCVRVISRHVRDVPGVLSLEADAARRLLRVRGDVDPALLLATLRSAGFGGCEVPAGGE